jgi:indole-3-glycerol phosphate synthase
VVESGIQNFDDVKMYRELGINTFLIGESLMRAENIGKKLKELTGAA